ncbi:enoyl-CoA hydratase [Enhygromyxa salina]|uniref:4-chlorobenzoyl coenzyme A dehalogenase-2 n=1 Tax=Enhygromyxa salina TaxID=215803 RepID=A0A2S9XLW8_9BACT|nr:enoyl-CoA hydratase [Enhygromyxa salina]PRP93869.1 4-chlorobenzoyl coenzyme A dehalogenase-2 [Enhygromyxa salina]
MSASSETSEHLHVDFDAGICTISFRRPKKKNAFSVAMYAAMVAGFEQARGRGDVRVILLRGSEGVFTAGNDLQDFMQAPPTGPDSPVAQFLEHLVACEKPIVAAVEGPAIGIGVTMLLHCDLVYAGESARFHMPFVNLALCPEAGSSYLLPRLMGYQRAAELLLLGEPFSAQLAYDYGLVNQVLADAAVLDRAHSIAVTLSKKPPAALRNSKRLMRDGYRAAVTQAMHTEFEAFGAGLVSPEAAEAFQAFFAKREPDFSKFQ